MSRARDYRKTKDGRSEDRFAERRRRFRPVMQLLGIDALFAATPRPFQEEVWKGKGPEPDAVAGEGVGAEVRADAQTALGRAGVEVEGYDGRKARLTFADLVAVILPLRAVLKPIGTGADIRPSVVRLNERALPLLERICDEHGLKVYEDAGRQLDAVMVWHGRAGARGYGWLIEPPRPAGEKQAMRFLIQSAEPETRHFRVDGVQRPAFRVGCTLGWYGYRRVFCPAPAVGGDADEAPLPVYVQSHALRQMHDRIDLPGVPPWADYFLAQSMANAVCARPSGKDVLIEYRLQDHKTGYLVVRRVGDSVLVRTFLFLTMAGTPEGDRLERKLRLTRDEAAWLGLHKLSSFAASDLRDDADLCAILGACGCAHLLEIGRGVPLSAKSAGLAAEVRKYIGMSPVRQTETGAEIPERLSEAA